MTVAIARTSNYERSISKLLTIAEIEVLESALQHNPEQGQVIPGLHGIRKVRAGRSGGGKRGGLRVIYYYYRRGSTVYMLTAYAKNDRDDLKPEEKKVLKRFVLELEKE